jgi:hypothetical protein
VKQREFFRPVIFHLLSAAVNEVEDGQLKASVATHGRAREKSPSPDHRYFVIARSLTGSNEIA